MVFFDGLDAFLDSELVSWLSFEAARELTGTTDPCLMLSFRGTDAADVRKMTTITEEIYLIISSLGVPYLANLVPVQILHQPCMTISNAETRCRADICDLSRYDYVGGWCIHRLNWCVPKYLEKCCHQN